MLGQPNKTFKTLKSKKVPTCVEINQSRLFIVGQGDKEITTNELVTFDQPPFEGPDLPFQRDYCCLVKVDERTIYIGKKCDFKNRITLINFKMLFPYS